MTIFEALKGPEGLIVLSDMSVQLRLKSWDIMHAYATAKMSLFLNEKKKNPSVIKKLDCEVSRVKPATSQELFRT